LILWLIPLLGYLYVRLVYLTSRVHYEGAPYDGDDSVVVICWHEHLLMAPYCWHHLRRNRKDKRVFVIASQHKDGEYITRLVKRLGVEGIRGSSSRGGARALLSAMRKMDRGSDLAIMPDGPRGPRHSVAPGVIALAQKKGCKIITMRYEASRYWRLKSWDRFVVPKPFGRLRLQVGEPFEVNDREMDAAKELIRARLGVSQD
jgi:lysophospholipid acyltransferase (LPLAT)-like uncharacterized protein